MKIKEILEKDALSHQDICDLLQIDNKSDFELLRNRAYGIMKEHCGEEYITDETYKKFIEELSDESRDYGEAKYYELCYELDIDEPPSPRVIAVQTNVQLAGMRMFLKKLEELEK